MERKLQIAQHVNLVDEVFILLYFWINKDDMEETREKYLENFQSDLEEYNNKFDILLGIYNGLKGLFAEKKERIEYFFKTRNVEFSTYCTLSILWEFHNYDNKLLSYEERFGAMSEEQKLATYAKLIDCDEFTSTPKEELKTLTDLITFIERSPYEKEAKWEVIKIYHNQKSYYDEATGIIKEAVELLQNKYATQIAILEDAFYKYWSEYQKEKSIIDSIKERLNISWESSIAGTIIIPMIFQPFSVSLSIDEEDSTKMDAVRIGIMMNQNFILTSKKIKKEDIVNIGKLLCDKSKVDILEYASKKPCYGKELANELNLSTATISYHVNALLKIGFLKADVSANKVYYSVNQERIAAYLEDVKDYFTNL